MAITPIQKIDIITYKEHRKEIVKYLQDRGLVQIVDIREEKVSLPVEEERDIEKELGSLTYILKFLSRFEEKKGILESFVKPKFSLSRKEFEKVTKEFNYQEVYEKCQRLEKRLNRLKHTFRKLHSWREEVLPWLGLDMLLSDVRPTEKTEVILGAISFRMMENLLKDLKKVTEEHLSFKIISESKVKRYILLIHLKENNQKVNETLKGYNFERVLYPKLGITPFQLNSFIDERLVKAEREREELITKGKALLKKSKVKVVALYDYLTNLKAQRDIQNSFSQTYGTFRIAGWIRKEDVKGLKSALEKRFKEIEVITKDPSPGERVPIALENRRVIRPFEFVTNLYGAPRYWEVDPTPLFAPFFFLFFGLCLTDAGYGIILVLISLFFLWKIKVGRRLFQLLILGGLAAVICGAFTGGWFGLEQLPPSLERLRLFIPLKEPMIFFILALSLGFIQIWFATLVKMYKNLKNKNFSQALFHQGSWVVIYLGILCFVLGRLRMEEMIMRIGLWSVYLGVFSRIILVGLFQKKKLLEMGKGLADILNGSKDFLSNILSYSRLMALGLATSAMAMVVNLIAKMAHQIPVIGYLFMFIILILGHLFVIAINTLGGFVHTARLQFVEFFPYFFEGGGRPFTPFKRREEYTTIK